MRFSYENVFFLSYSNEIMYLLCNLPFFKMVSSKTNFPDVQTGFRKANKLPTSVGSLKKQKSSRKTPSSVVSVAQSCLTLCDPMDSSLPGSSVHGICFIDYAKAFDCVDHNKLENS